MSAPILDSRRAWESMSRGANGSVDLPGRNGAAGTSYAALRLAAVNTRARGRRVSTHKTILVLPASLTWIGAMREREKGRPGASHSRLRSS
eukprot:328831-Rhodomonas_salina.1